MRAAEESSYLLHNLDCADCAQKIEDRLNRTPGIQSAFVNFGSGTLTISSDLDHDIEQTVRQTVREIDPDIDLVLTGTPGKVAVTEWRSEHWVWLRIAISTGLFLVGLIFQAQLSATWNGWAEIAVMLPAYLLSGYPVLLAAARNIRRGQIFDENFLMTLATAGAWVIGEIPEAVGVMIFYMIGETLQDLSVRRSRRSIQALLAVRPDTANLVTGEKFQPVPVEDVKPGDRIVIRPGDRIPLDGIVRSGNSQVDTSAMTGESVPRRICVGDEVLAGMINQTDSLYVEVTRPSSDSAISRILKMVEIAASRKAPTERFISQFARYYTPAVVLAAAAIAILPPLLIPGATFTEWMHRSLVVLVISCPCALVISIPLGYFGGVGAASRQGILIKGSNYLDILARVKTVVFDKTGTLTKGVFKVVEVQPVEGKSGMEILELALEAEAHSSHPIAQSIRAASLQEHIPSVEHSEEISGLGVRTRSNGREVLAGNDTLMHREEVMHPVCDLPGTVVHIAENGRYAGYLIVDDEVKGEAKQAIDELRAIGVRDIIILSGDREDKVARMAETLGVDEYHAGLLPDNKVAALEAILDRSPQNRARRLCGGWDQ